jgi:hypothetical protein
MSETEIPPDPNSGLELIRATLRAWNSKPGGLAFICRQDKVGVDLTNLEHFAMGRIPELPNDALDRLAKVLMHAAGYDSERDKLIVKPVPITQLPAAPKPFDPKNPAYKDFVWTKEKHERSERQRRERNPPPKNPSPAIHHRPGWIETDSAVST